jgi:hypothetical protein
VAQQCADAPDVYSQCKVRVINRSAHAPQSHDGPDTTDAPAPSHPGLAGRRITEGRVGELLGAAWPTSSGLGAAGCGAPLEPHRQRGSRAEAEAKPKCDIWLDTRQAL